MNLTAGTRLGRYEVRSLLGMGGMGEVYLAYDHDLEREVAIKILRDAAGGSAERVMRFVQEAKAASALNHPNVATVFEIGSQDELRFIAMELIPGQSLRERLRNGALSLDEAVALSIQIASGVAAAHHAGIVHRDIKPENVIVRPDGYAKVLDFGLAKLRQLSDPNAATLLKTATGTTMGTLGYMAPEQLSGSDVTPAADVFSLGVVLYEMLSGRRPFTGANQTEVATAILSKSPPPLKVPKEILAIVNTALAKKPEERFADAAQMLEALREIDTKPLSPRPRSRWRSRAVWSLAIILVVVGAGLAAWRTVQLQRARHAADSIASAERLLHEGRFFQAYETASTTLMALPNEQRLRDVVAKSSESASFESDPPGATVYLERYQGPAGRVRAGLTPFTILHLPLADYVVTLERAGYASAQLPLSQYPLFLHGEAAPSKPARVSVKLLERDKVPPEMVAVPGGEYTLAGSWRASDRRVLLRPYLMDRYEVSNRDYEAFVRDGGYRRRELWTTIPFAEVEKRFRDVTGLPGPRGWSGGVPPAGRENYPVADVTWHEAAAYAHWRGKQLPTIYQWEKASRYPRVAGISNTFPWGLLTEGVDATERMNFNGKGTMPVDSMPFGIGPYGSHHQAGNVSEWTRNPLPPGYAARGGSWNDALYTFSRTGAFPAMYASAEVGFRCVKQLEGDGSDQGEFALSVSGFVPTYVAVDDKAFEEIRARYDYQQAPLQARVVERVDQGDWIREKIEYVVDGRTVPAYLYLPKNFRRPLQVIHFSPAGDVYNGWRTLPHSIETTLGPIIRGGRAVFAVVMQGFIGRPDPPGFVEPDSRSVEYVDYSVHQVTELRRGLDYLGTRPDLNSSRISFCAISAGSATGVVLAGVEHRYRSVMFIGSRIRSEEVSDTPMANRINFAPRISGPKLMLQGHYDESAPLKSGAEPLFGLLREPKRLEVFEGGHVPSQNVSIPTMTKWFDETLGRVE